MKAKIAGAVLVALALSGAGAVASAPPASAECGSTVVWGNGGGQCDGPFYPDGSFQRCVTVYVLGIGGSNCFIVPPPPPPP
ncbi:CDGP domain-containing protein [Mycolicibacterium cosmeticum]|jgi:hypothetical protein|uniref:CDGP domain-containing protein n=1 Tax=Mycolicibacterium cosmeticum TaxID=258533 RepID=UPI003204B868